MGFRARTWLGSGANSELLSDITPEVVQGAFDALDGVPQGCWARRIARAEDGKPVAKEARVAPGEEDGDAKAEIGDAVAMGLGDASDEPMQAQSAQVVSHLALRHEVER